MEGNFKLGVEGEGFFFFLPDSYNKDLQVFGSGVRRSINGTGRRDITGKKYIFQMTFEWASALDSANLFALFTKNIDEEKVLTFEDDSGSYQVMWGGNNFGLSERKQSVDEYWSGTIILEEI